MGTVVCFKLVMLYVGEFASLEIGEIVNLQVDKPVGLMRLWVRKLMT